MKHMIVSLLTLLLFASCASPDSGYQTNDDFFGSSSVQMTSLSEVWPSDSSIIIIRALDRGTGAPLSCVKLDYNNREGLNVERNSCLEYYADTVTSGLYSVGVDVKGRQECGWMVGRENIVVLPRHRVEITFLLRVPTKY